MHIVLTRRGAPSAAVPPSRRDSLDKGYNDVNSAHLLEGDGAVDGEAGGEDEHQPEAGQAAGDLGDLGLAERAELRGGRMPSVSQTAMPSPRACFIPARRQRGHSRRYTLDLQALDSGPDSP